MAKQRIINTQFWDDRYIRSLGPSGKLIYLYLFTGPLVTISGAYEITLDHIAFHTAVSELEIDSWMQKFDADGKATYRDGWMLVHNTIDHQTTTNPKIRSAIEISAKCCPDWIKHSLSIRYEWLSHLNLNSNLNLNSKNGETPVAAVAAAVENTVENQRDETDLWTAGIELLKTAKMTEAQARPFLGRLARQYTAAELHTAIAVSSAEKPADARAFLIGVLKKRAKDKARIEVGRNDATDDDCTDCWNMRWTDPPPEAIAAGYDAISCPSCRPDDYAFVMAQITAKHQEAATA